MLTTDGEHGEWIFGQFVKKLTIANKNLPLLKESVNRSQDPKWSSNSTMTNMLIGLFNDTLSETVKVSEFIL